MVSKKEFLILQLLVKQRLIFIFVKYLQIINFEQGRSHEKDGLKNDAAVPSCSPASSGRLSPTSDSELSFSNSPSPSYVRFTSSPASSADSIYSPVYSPAADDIDETDENEMMSIDDGCSVTESPLNILVIITRRAVGLTIRPCPSIINY